MFYCSRFRALVKMYNRDANAAIVCYDITDKNSWPALKRYVEDLREINPVSCSYSLRCLNYKERITLIAV